MTKLDLRPYCPGDAPPSASVPITVVVLTYNEEVNIRRCLSSVAWADQVLVIDSGSTDATVSIARSLSVKVVSQSWLGFSGQREFAIRLPLIKHNWVYFVDADEWVSSQLAEEIRMQLQAPSCAAFAHRFRIVFLGRWIRHCGWYNGSWIVRIVNRQHTTYDQSLVGERPCIDGQVHRLCNDLVDEDLKGLATWLHKHVRYAELEVLQRKAYPSPKQRFAQLRARDRTRPFVRIFLKDVLFPSVPGKPLALFLYMYVLRLGLLDGLAGLRFCFFHAWYEAAVAALDDNIRLADKLQK